MGPCGILGEEVAAVRVVCIRARDETPEAGVLIFYCRTTAGNRRDGGARRLEV
jgi:hypothetical protein